MNSPTRTQLVARLARTHGLKHVAIAFLIDERIQEDGGETTIEAIEDIAWQFRMRKPDYTAVISESGMFGTDGSLVWSAFETPEQDQLDKPEQPEQKQAQTKSISQIRRESAEARWSKRGTTDSQTQSASYAMQNDMQLPCKSVCDSDDNAMQTNANGMQNPFCINANAMQNQICINANTDLHHFASTAEKEREERKQNKESFPPTPPYKENKKKKEEIERGPQQLLSRVREENLDLSLSQNGQSENAKPEDDKSQPAQNENEKPESVSARAREEEQQTKRDNLSHVGKNPQESASEDKPQADDTPPAANAQRARLQARSFMAQFNQRMEIAGARIPRIKSLSGTRAELFAARLREFGQDNILLAIDKAAASSFLNGHTEKAFVANFDWIFRPNNFPKVLEGNYDDIPVPEMQTQTQTQTTQIHLQDGTTLHIPGPAAAARPLYTHEREELERQHRMQSLAQATAEYCERLRNQPPPGDLPF